ncbi:MAG: alpha/beta fold hydrolase [Thermodesulfobacteriota bacterium]|nr:alpha/beta fold hydrolase [Thermodesulfobacteriota bacterium]
MKEEKVFFPYGGVQLEGLLNIHEALSVKGGVILCHPHPQYGGDMHNRVITTALGSAHQEGFSTLRFNFRGVGSSGGSYGEGIGEMEDVRAAIEFLHSRQKDSNLPLILLGYSFGACTGIPVAIKDERIKGVVAISPPLDIYDFNFMKGYKKKKLIVVGDQDIWCPSSRLEEWYQQLDEPKSLTLIQGVDHFYSYQANLLTQPLRNFFNSEF